MSTGYYIEEYTDNGRLPQVKIFQSIVFIAACAVAPATAQNILTADQFFKDVSAQYMTIKDYQAQLEVLAGKQIMSGTVLYKAPSLMRMDFSAPASQVIVYDGQSLVIYVPEFRAILNQQTGVANPAGAATSQGLRMLGRSYSIAFETVPDPVPLPGSETEQVVRLVLSRLSVAEGFRNITLSVDPKRLLIRRMEGTTLAGDLIQYDFTKIILDQDIPATKFIYDSPASANIYNNFLFSSDN